MAMEHRTLTRYLLMIFLAVCWSRNSSPNPQREMSARVSKSERTVVFPDYNDTEHSLPVFPDPVVAYVGSERPLAPPVDKFGRPLCTKKSRDSFCESVDSYPLDEIRKTIHYSDEFAELFPSKGINPRGMSGELDEDTVCPQYSRLFYPKAAVNENDQWAYVINDVDYIQTVMAEICQGEDDQPCRYLDGALPTGVSSRCRQKYAYKRLLALHPNKKKTYTDAFRFPSCCVCFVKKPFLVTRTRLIDVRDQVQPDKIRKTAHRNVARQ